RGSVASGRGRRRFRLTQGRDAWATFPRPRFARGLAGDDNALLQRLAHDGLDLEPVEVEGEGAVETRGILRARSRRAGVATAMRERGGMEGMDLGARLRAEADVKPDAGTGALAGLRMKVRLEPEHRPAGFAPIADR